MAKSPTVDNSAQPGGSGLEFGSLRAAGIRQLEQFANDRWTDFNTHDPGITILEQACWALTDLGYRLEHPIPDLLADCDGDGTSGIASPAEALDCDPVIMADLRRLALDVEGVMNVWIEPDEAPEPQLHYHRERRTLGTREALRETDPLLLRGLWQVLIACDNYDDRTESTIIAQVAERFFAHRPLGQDFTAIEVLAAEPVAVQADIEIGPVADAESLTVEVLRRIADYIAPRVKFRALQRENDDAVLEDLFEGPTLRQGFIDESDLPDARRRANLRTSDLIQVIMDVPGVRAVRHIRLANAVARMADAEWVDWVLDLDPHKTPRLELLPDLIELRRAQVPVRIDPGRIVQRLRHLQSVARKQATPTGPVLSCGHKRNIGRYHSILFQFPEVFGVGPAGLPSGSSKQRHGQANQLKAYLQLVDQLLADSFAQVANAAGLLSSDGTTARAYAAGEIEAEGLHLDSVRFDPTGYQASAESRAEAASASAEGIGLRRRQLDHLLARVGETFVDPVITGTADAEDTADGAGWDGLSVRHALLTDSAAVTSSRGSAGDSLRPFGDSNRGGLERRIALKLGLNSDLGESFVLVEHVLLRALADPDGESGDNQQTEPLLRDVASADPYSLQLSFVFPAERGRFAEDTEVDADTESEMGTGPLDFGFRRFVEHLIREETPAHLVPYVHWLGDAEFDAFRESLRNWHERRRLSLMQRFSIQPTGGQHE